LTGHKLVTPADVRQWITFAHGSPHYHHLAEVIASDPDLMRVLNRIEHTPNTNVLFAGVQFLMKKGEGANLAEYFPNFTPEPLALAEVDCHFKDFVLNHEDRLVEIGGVRFTQTNECRRCTALLPGVWETPIDRFHLIDVGCSAGLNLALDRYGYRWGDLAWGIDSSLTLESELRGRGPSVRDIEVLSRIGLDLNPIYPTDSDDRLWLWSLIWPEQHSRRERLVAALELLKDCPMDFVSGDATMSLNDVLTRLPAGEPVIVMNSFAMNQFSPAMREDLEMTVARHRANREIYRISFEVYNSPNQWASLQIDNGSGFEIVGQAHIHGEWLELYV